MNQFDKEIIEVGEFLGNTTYATFYKPNSTKYVATILYLHGGGLVFGEREDLPEEYLQLFAESGYGLLSFDYPLAPETKLPEIMTVVENNVQWFINHSKTDLQLPTSKYFIMGRSAGAYLALSLASHKDIQPEGVISLYGYFNLNDASFTTQNRYYLQFPKLVEKQINNLIKTPPIFEEPIAKRYPIYIYARQNGNWMSYLFDSNEEISSFSLSKEDFRYLPPAFISAAQKDKDVPVRQSKQLANNLENVTTLFVDSDEHDFDRTEIQTNGMKVYKEMINWLKQF